MNTSRTADELLASLGPLTSKETKSLLAQLALRVKNTTSPKGERDSETWADCVAEALNAALGSSAGSALVRKEMLASAAWTPVRQFLEEARFLDLSVREKQSVYRLVARLLVKYADRIATRRGVPLSPHFVASCAGHVATAFDDAFPGYLASGLAHVVVRKLCAERLAA